MITCHKEKKARLKGCLNPGLGSFAALETLFRSSSWHLDISVDLCVAALYSFVF
jgi:hypothetical protein